MSAEDTHDIGWRASAEEKFAEITVLLDQTYGPRPWHRHGDPVDVLVGTILSQNTSDTNSARAFASLNRDFASWDEVRNAPTECVAASIRSGGLANLKAPRIQRVLTSIVHHRGSYNLAMLEELPVAEAMTWLTALDGVGPKTAACVLLFSLGRPALPVDTHVHRVARRLGLIGAKVSAERAHEELLELLPETTADIYAFHVEMIAHGRSICVARRPKCSPCPLRHLCRYAQQMEPETRVAA